MATTQCLRGEPEEPATPKRAGELQDKYNEIWRAARLASNDATGHSANGDDGDDRPELGTGYDPIPGSPPVPPLPEHDPTPEFFELPPLPEFKPLPQ